MRTEEWRVVRVGQGKAGEVRVPCFKNLVNFWLSVICLTKCLRGIQFLGVHIFNGRSYIDGLNIFLTLGIN